MAQLLSAYQGEQGRPALKDKGQVPTGQNRNWVLGTNGTESTIKGITTIRAKIHAKTLSA